ncbi:MAG TPA: hypothetical protein VEG38_18740, partial [Acidimicrobiia bacterium]|nr:hypothetical protein [Acidimicrobiia bacterium]
MRAMSARARPVVAVAVTLVPWTWFAVRDLSYGFDVVATGLPVLFTVAAAVIAAYATVGRHRPLVLAVLSWLVAGT